MGLETSTFLSGLTPSWPLPSDRKSVGDDHLGLIKAVLQNTFPTANKAFRFPTTTSQSASFNILTSDQNSTIFVDTSSDNLNGQLPATLGVGDAGWFCDIVKTSSDANGVTVFQSGANITSKVGSTSSIRVGVLAEPARLFWNGTGWFCFKFGTMIGVTENYDGGLGGTAPPGYLPADGSTFNASLFAELVNALGTNVLFDKRGRVEAGLDAGANRLVLLSGGVAVGSTGGSEAVPLSVANLPSHTHANSIDNPTHVHTINGGVVSVQNGTATPQGNLFVTTGGTPVVLTITSTAPGLTITNASIGSGTNHSNTQPTVMVRKIIRAC